MDNKLTPLPTDKQFRDTLTYLAQRYGVTRAAIIRSAAIERMNSLDKPQKRVFRIRFTHHDTPYEIQRGVTLGADENDVRETYSEYNVIDIEEIGG